MRKNILLLLMLAVCGSSTLYAGTMGAASTTPAPIFRPFLIGEAAYSWPQVQGINLALTSLANVTTRASLQGWGGRIASGIMRPISDRFSLSFEGGLMYNDHVSFQPVYSKNGNQIIPNTNAVPLNIDQYGFDLLTGIVYSKPQYDLFFKAGALFENTRTRMGMNGNQLLLQNRRRFNFIEGATQNININIGQVMPEIKLGAGYHVTDNWSATIAWMHAFGGTLGVDSDELSFKTDSATIGHFAANLNSPTINSVMFGVQYLFS